MYSFINYTIFDFLYPRYKITKPIRLIELFAGYGSQALALKYLGVKFEYWKICEWAINSIQAYNDLHFQDYTDYSKNISDDEILDKLIELGVSINYNDSATREQLKRRNFKKIYNNISATKNLTDIKRVKATDLKIVDKDKYDYILTYSFPCQDLSLAGKRKGMSDTSTRSGLLWEVERILSECQELGELPQILLMENVPQVHSQDNIEDFNKWQLRLEKLGYKNYVKDLIATDYEIPQTRNRCFMISILGDYSYTFPRNQPLKIKLKDLLEENVSETYYLSEKIINLFYKNEKKQQEKGNGFKFGVSDGNVIAKTITTRACSRMDDNFIKVKTNTQKGYEEASEGDCIDFTQPKSKTRRGRVQKNKAQTLTTQNSLGVVTIGNYSPSNYNASRIVDSKGCSPTVMENHGTVTATQDTNLRIRKLTPHECFRLMGVKDEDFEKISKNQSNSSLYHLAGDSIVVNVLMAIFKEFFEEVEECKKITI